MADIAMVQDSEDARHLLCFSTVDARDATVRNGAWHADTISQIFDLIVGGISGSAGDFQSPVNASNSLADNRTAHGFVLLRPLRRISKADSSPAEACLK